MKISGRGPHPAPGRGREIPGPLHRPLAKSSGQARQPCVYGRHQAFPWPASVASVTPVSAPFQPAWQAPITPASGIGKTAPGRNRPSAHQGRCLWSSSPGHPPWGARLCLHGICHFNRIGAVDLMCRHEIRCDSDAERTRHRLAVHAHQIRIITRSQPAIERGKNAGGMAAATGEKAVGNAGKVQGLCCQSCCTKGVWRRQAPPCDRHHLEKVAHLGRMCKPFRCRDRVACGLSPSIVRDSTSVRASSPMALRKSPCVMSPATTRHLPRRHGPALQNPHAR